MKSLYLDKVYVMINLPLIEIFLDLSLGDKSHTDEEYEKYLIYKIGGIYIYCLNIFSGHLSIVVLKY